MLSDTLIDALFAGLSEEPPWTTFLDVLRRHTGADHAFLYCQPTDSTFGRGVYRWSGEITTDEDEESFFRNRWLMGPVPWTDFENGRVYDVLAIIRANASRNAALVQQLEQHRISAVRLMKVTDPTGVVSSLFLSKAGGALAASADQTLTQLAPVLRGAVQVYVAREHERYRASFGIDAVRRSRIGWLTLDGRGRVIEHDEGCAPVLGRGGMLGIAANGRLMVDPLHRREVYGKLRAIADGTDTRPHSIILCREPWIELTLQPARRKPVSAGAMETVLMYVHYDLEEAATDERRAGEMLNLSPRETELALVLARGASVKQAAAELGLTVLTARSYLRSIYSKTGAKGLTDLVRILTRSSLRQEA